jgi:peptidyl-prolyl cis-trans isomerase B (cyclophilin B)
MRLMLCALVLCAVGCSSADSTSNSADASPAPPVNPSLPSPTTSTQTSAAPVSSLINQDGSIDAGLPKTAGWGAKLPKDGDPIVILTTNEGRIVLKFFPQKAPRHVKNFLDLAKKNFYDGTKFHRVIPGFMIQGGDPNTKLSDTSTWGQGGPGYTVKAEFNDIPHTPGILSMARTSDPDGAGSQFFIMHARTPSLDGQYSVFGQVIEGMDVVNKIATTPTGENNRPIKDMVLEKAEVTKWPIKLK